MAALLVLAAPSAASASDDYLCTVKEVRELSNGGELVAPTPAYATFLIGQRFTVDRVTGEMTGDVEHPALSRVVVIDKGSAEQSFKVAAVSRAEEHGRLNTLHVQEFADTPYKPFIYQDATRVRSGTCVHL